jgi:para-nitrobenzyl esterase
MLGNMADELSYWSFYDSPTSHICQQTVKENLFTTIDPKIQPKIQELYDLYSKDPQRVWKNEGDILLAMGDDYAFRVQALQLAAQQTAAAKTYYYRVDYPVNLPQQPCQDKRAPHGAELPFVFGQIDNKSGYDFIGTPRDAADEAHRKHLMQQMIRAWSSFAKTGDPNGGDLPVWPIFDAASQPTMIFSGDAHIVNAPFNAEYQAMAEFMRTFSVFDALK